MTEKERNNKMAVSIDRKAEVYVRRGRALTHANMGSTDSPEAAITILTENAQVLTSYLEGQLVRLRGGGFPPYRMLKIETSDAVMDYYERLRTAQLELAILYGREDVIDSILGNTAEQRRRLWQK